MNEEKWIFIGLVGVFLVACFLPLDNVKVLGDGHGTPLVILTETASTHPRDPRTVSVDRKDNM